jgi:hypothetical protein
VKTTILAVLCSLSLAAFPVVAQDKKDEKKAPSVAQKKQQERMKDCNEKVGERKGDERKKFMSACLKGDMDKGKGAKMTEQQSRMKDCNRQAGDKGMKGDERKKFMSTCLKN